TDQAGETHQAEIALPLGNRKTALRIDVAEKVLVEEGGKVTFHLLNAAGNDIDTNVKYKIEKIPAAGNTASVRWITAKTNTPVTLAKMASGRYRITAQPANATDDMEPAEREFIVFSLDDKRPAIETDDWFYIHKRQFPNTGAPVTYQVGSSDKDVHVLYAITAGEKLLESGTVNLTNELVNRKLNYKEEYGNGVLIAYAWVKNGKAYHHEATVKRPVPDVLMKMKWETFRNRLTPGQQEEWTLTITHPDGTPANNAQLMAALYDKSLDQIASHDWSMVPHQYLPQPSTRWLMQAWSGFSLNGSARTESRYVPDFRLNHFDHEVYPSYYYASNMLFKKMRMRGDIVEEAPMLLGAAAGATMDFAERKVEEESAADTDEGSMKKDDAQPKEQQEQLQMRENLQETAFFYPQLMADSTGRVAIKFTLPESLTTWRFLSVAHTQDMMYATMQDEAVAQKDVMIQPNMPRFVRHGDNSTISARVFNTSQQAQNGTARLQLIDPETEKVVYDKQQQVSIAAGGTSGVSFIVPCSQFDQSLLIAKMMVSGATFSDGEQHYLPILPDKERVTVTVPFTQNEPGTKTIDLSALVPNNATQGKLTVEYTNNPAWLMIQALPSVGHPYDDCAICQATSFYANALGRHILNQNPQAKDVFEMWTRETGQETTLMSNLQKNQELKDLVLNETPWVRDADREVQQKQLLADFFDKNLMSNRINQAVEKLKKLQRGDGSWSWWPDMPGSFYMTLEVSEMLVRLNQMAGMQKETENMLQNAIDYLGDDIVEMVKQMKKYEKKGYKQSFPSNMALQWLYICAIDGRDLPSKVKSANEYLIKLLKKENKRLSIYGKSMAAIILNDKTYIKSLKEYTVYREDIGRYYDTGRALYSWFDYRIPTQVAAIEALQRLSPDDSITIDEMRRWLLQSKRTQAWDTPINSVNATYAFMNNRPEVLKAQPKTSLRIDGSELETPQATAGLGYIKTAVPIQGQKTFEAEKTSTGTSWGAVYAQFMQPSSEITDLQSGITVTREILVGNDLSPLTSGTASLKVGDRIKVRLTIVADRDYDFVQVVDKRAACMEPVSQRSGYQWREGYYYAPKDCSTNFYFDMLRKGKHVITTEYYIDREGTYETGTCSAQCAYSPEFRGTTKSVTLRVEK
ncbi:MAG: alpha-2-macroglobulin, partial [Prevotella sp.]|nr:alpha-2-macroglobulin [Prevotella sp.]